MAHKFGKEGLLKLINDLSPASLFHAGATSEEGMLRPPIRVPEDFPYKEALEILKQKDQKYYEKALVGWPKGAEETQTTIDMMKSKAQKLPEKNIPSTHANAKRRSSNGKLLSNHLRAHSAFFFTHGTVSIARKS